MPNHITNYLSVVGDPFDLDAFADAARGSMPRTGDTGANNPNADIGKDRPVEALCFHSLVPLPERYSQLPYSPHGYEMERATWGIKWGAYSQQPPVRIHRCLTYKFQTAWSPPAMFVEKVAAKWPMLKFFLSWGGEGPTAGRDFYTGTEAVLEDAPYDAKDYPNQADFLGDEDAWSSAYQAVQNRYLLAHHQWVSKHPGVKL